MLGSLVLLTLGSVGYKIYKSTEKKPEPAADANQVDVNDPNTDTRKD
jgi:hypothetical protein